MDKILISKGLLEEILNYLANKPYIEVAKLINKLTMEANQSITDKKDESDKDTLQEQEA